MSYIDYIESKKQEKKISTFGQLDTLHRINEMAEDTMNTTIQFEQTLSNHMPQFIPKKSKILNEKDYSIGNTSLRDKMSLMIIEQEKDKNNIPVLSSDIVKDKQGHSIDSRMFRTCFNGYKVNQDGEPLNPAEEEKKSKIDEVIRDYTFKDKDGKFDLSKRERHLEKLTKEILSIQITKDMLTKSYLSKNINKLLSITYNLNFFEGIYNDPVNADFFDKHPLIKDLIALRKNRKIENEFLHILTDYLGANSLTLLGKICNDLSEESKLKLRADINRINLIDENKEYLNEQKDILLACKKQLERDIEDYKRQAPQIGENEMLLPFLSDTINSEITQIRSAFADNYLQYEKQKEILDSLYSSYYNTMYLYSKSQGDISAYTAIIEKYHANETFEIYNVVSDMADQKMKLEQAKCIKLHVNLQATKELMLFILSDNALTDNALVLAKQKGIDKEILQIQDNRKKNPAESEAEMEQEILNMIHEYKNQKLNEEDQSAEKEIDVNEELNQLTTWEETEENKLHKLRENEAKKWLANREKHHPEELEIDYLSKLGYAHATTVASGTPTQENILNEKTTRKKSLKERWQNFKDSIKARWHLSSADHVSYHLHENLSYLNTTRKDTLTKEEKRNIEAIGGSIDAVQGLLSGGEENIKRDSIFKKAFSSNQLNDRINALKTLTNEIMQMSFDTTMLHDDNIEQNISILKLNLDKLKSFSEIMKDPTNKDYFDSLSDYQKKILENRTTDRYNIMLKLIKLKVESKGIDFETGKYLSEKKAVKANQKANIKIKKYCNHLKYNNAKEKSLFVDYYKKEKKAEMDSLKKNGKELQTLEKRSEKGWQFTSYSMQRSYEHFENFRSAIVNNKERYLENKALLDKLYQQIYRLMDAKGDFDLEETALGVLADSYKHNFKEIANQATEETLSNKRKNSILGTIIGDFEYLFLSCLGVDNNNKLYQDLAVGRTDIKSIAKELGYYSEIMPIILMRQMEKNESNPSN